MTIRSRPRTEAQRWKRNRFLGLQDITRRIEQARDELDVRIEMRDQDIRAWHGKGPGQLLVPEIAIATGLSQREVEEIIGIEDVIVSATNFS